MNSVARLEDFRIDARSAPPLGARITSDDRRWDLGIVAPATPSVGSSEPPARETTCLLDAVTPAQLLIHLTFLQIQQRSIEAIDPAKGIPHRVSRLELEGRLLTTGPETLPHRRTFRCPIRMRPTLISTRVDIDCGCSVEDVIDRTGVIRARLVRESWRLSGRFDVNVERVDEQMLVRLRFENDAASAQHGQQWSMLERSFLNTQLSLAVEHLHAHSA